MKKQKICIIGDGLAAYASALMLGNLNIEIDLIQKKNKIKKIKDNRSIALSENNLLRLSKNFNKSDLKHFWPSKKIDLFNENYEHFFKFENNGENIIHITKNEKFRKIILRKIKKNKQIKIINEKVEKIETDKTIINFERKKKREYDLIILCLGENSKILLNLFNRRYIQDDKDEIAFTAFVKHNYNIINPSQYFLKEGPLAILPLNKKTFSYVWSVDKKFKNYSTKNINQIILNKFQNIFGKKKFHIQEALSFPISFKFSTNLFKQNIFVLGSAWYKVPPLAGQGFNLVLRDIFSLYENLKKNMSLGIQIKNSIILNDFYSNRKAENFLYGLGINFTQNFFRQNKLTALLKNGLLKDLKKYTFLKKIGIKIADKGIFN
tara:strand:- start:7240 stop:8376 length:1137 start_codon:yes stop_codon:yes gene_type:complete